MARARVSAKFWSGMPWVVSNSIQCFTWNEPNKHVRDRAPHYAGHTGGSYKFFFSIKSVSWTFQDTRMFHISICYSCSRSSLDTFTWGVRMYDCPVATNCRNVPAARALYQPRVVGATPTECRMLRDGAECCQPGTSVKTM